MNIYCLYTCLTHFIYKTKIFHKLKGIIVNKYNFIVNKLGGDSFSDVGIWTSSIKLKMASTKERYC